MGEENKEEALVHIPKEFYISPNLPELQSKTFLLKIIVPDLISDTWYFRLSLECDNCQSPPQFSLVQGDQTSEQLFLRPRGPNYTCRDLEKFNLEHGSCRGSRGHWHGSVHPSLHVPTPLHSPGALPRIPTSFLCLATTTTLCAFPKATKQLLPSAFLVPLGGRTQIAPF